MPPCLSRLWRALRDTRTGAAATRARNELPQLRTALLRAIEDCDGQNAERLQRQIRHARNHRDLWMLRSDAYRLIALQHCQSIAEQRIRQLLHLFEGRVAPHELSL